MRVLGNTLVWLGLMVGLPGVIYSMTSAEKKQDNCATPHSPGVCGVCRYFRELKVAPPEIKDDNVILVSPGHAGDERDESFGDEAND